MPAKSIEHRVERRSIANALKGWVMSVLTLTLGLLYIASLSNWVDPIEDKKIVEHLEPVVFVIMSLEEKLKNVRTTLVSSGLSVGKKNQLDSSDGGGWSAKEDAIRQSVNVAINILSS